LIFQPCRSSTSPLFPLVLPSSSSLAALFVPHAFSTWARYLGWSRSLLQSLALPPVKTKNSEFPADLRRRCPSSISTKCSVNCRIVLSIHQLGTNAPVTVYHTKHSSPIIAHEIDIVDSTDPSPPAVYKAPRVAMVYPHASLLASIPCSDLNLGALCSSFSFSVSF
jgi:hypothetical protein